MNTLRCCWLRMRPFMWTKDNQAGATARGACLLPRRQFLRSTAAGFGMLGLAGMLGSIAQSARATPLPSRPRPHFAPRAKRAIFLFMNGGPSHVDTFDPKPALAKYEGQQPSGNLFKPS